MCGVGDGAPEPTMARVIGKDHGIKWPNGKTKVESPLLGRYNISNLLAVLTVLYSKGYHFQHALSKLRNFSGIPGRMERIDEGQDFKELWFETVFKMSMHNGSKIRFMNMPMPEEPIENDELDNLESIL